MPAQCGILFIGPCGKDQPRIDALRSLGFRVDESAEMPTAKELAVYHAIIVRASANGSLPMIGARLRAQPHFGRRILLALVNRDVPEHAKREAVMSGFDRALSDSSNARELASHIIRLLRVYPEYRCLLRAPGRRKAA